MKKSTARGGTSIFAQAVWGFPGSVGAVVEVVGVTIGVEAKSVRLALIYVGSSVRCAAHWKRTMRVRQRLGRERGGHKLLSTPATMMHGAKSGVDWVPSGA